MKEQDMKKIRLLHPENNATTGPLQAYSFPVKPVPGDDARGKSPGSDGGGIRWDKLEEVAEDRSFPGSVEFAWENSGLPRAKSYSLLVSRDPDFSLLDVKRKVTGSSSRVENLYIGERYFWKVIAEAGNGRVVESPVRAFMTNPSVPRWIRVPGISNVRDMGGWPAGRSGHVRQGLVFRSSEMNSHVNIEKRGVRVLVDELKIRTDLDLRGDNEDTRPVLDSSRVEWINVPVRPYGSIIDEENFESYRRVFEMFSEESKYPVLFHCWGGADRGGTVAFLLHALLGLRLSDLIMDYELTSFSRWGERTHKSEGFQALLGALRPFAEKEDDITGQVENYLKHAGLEQNAIVKIRKQLIARETCAGLPVGRGKAGRGRDSAAASGLTRYWKGSS